MIQVRRVQRKGRTDPPIDGGERHVRYLSSAVANTHVRLLDIGHMRIKEICEYIGLCDRKTNIGNIIL